ncbi:hypothetical protein V3G39_11205 [Dermatophilaceae bacterium Sec6.4]|nr:hypothetical protein [Actinomycetota bacterium]
MSMKKTLSLAAAGAACIALPMTTAPAAFASSGTTNLTANLTQLNQSGASGKVMASLTGNQLQITITSQGMSANLPHAQHIHIGGMNTCPTANQKGKGTDGHLRTTDAADQYGAVKVSLTTSGDTSAKSALAVTRFPVGNATYKATITLSADDAAQVREGHGVIVRHGIDYNKNGKYDGAGKSDLDPALPEEATDPAVCGVLNVSQMNTVPKGGVNTGYASTTDSTNSVAIGGGAAAIALGAAGVVLMRRRKQSNV